MKIQIQKWGNSLALRIPKSFAIETSLEQGSVVDLSLKNGRIIVRPMPKQEYTLDELLSGISKKNLHDEVDTGNAVGKEGW
jgi:antitoxin MazE